MVFMKTKIICFLCCLWVSFVTCQAQDTIRLYGGYIQINSSRLTTNVGLDIFVYFAPGSVIPDSIYLFNKGSAGKSEDKILCNNVTLQKYYLEFWGANPDGIEAGAYFKDATTLFMGKNDTIKRAFPALSGNNDNVFLTQTITFKDNALVVVEKGKTAIINLAKGFKLQTLRFPNYSLGQIGSSFIPEGMMVNQNTGDIFIDGRDLDTGYFTFVLEVHEYTNAASYYFFTVSVVDTILPYFKIPEAQKRDSLGIPYLAATRSDSLLSYHVTYINTAGLGQYLVNWESAEQHKKTPQLSAVKVNDSTLQIDLSIPIDSIGFISSALNDTVFVWGNEKNLPLYETLPETFSITVTTTDNSGLCRNDMTSFYISRDPLRVSGISELSHSQKVSIYPNPNSGSFTVSLNDNRQKTIQVFDVLGNKVSQLGSAENDTTIVLPDAAMGIYFISIQTVDDSYRSKIIVE